MVKRCEWAKSEEMIKYHDKEWGVPVHEDIKLFEFLILEGAQAGLSWSTILKRQETYRKAFNDFDPKIVSNYNEEDVKRLLNDPGIIRNKLKIAAAINNSKKFLELQKEFGSFDRYLWSFVNHEQIVNNPKELSDIPATSEISDEISKDLKKRGFSFVGSTICYAFMQAVGMVDDHLVDCFRKN